MFTVEMLPAENGDCLWIEYGTRQDVYRILIDTGTTGAFPALEARIQLVPADKRRVDLFVVSHVDADHIGGAVRLLKSRQRLNLSFGDVWFNGYVHLVNAKDDLLGPVQGEELTAAIVGGRLPWNKAFNGDAVVVPTRGVLPEKDVSGMKLTLLSPWPQQLVKLQPVWESTVIAAGLTPGADAQPEEEEAEEEGDLLGEEALDVEALATEKFNADTAEPNGSSIAFLAEFGGKSVLFGADAHSPVLQQSVERLCGKKKLSVDVFKLPHHGSRANLSSDLLHKLSCRSFLVSTNGKRFRHPDQQAIARAIENGANALFTFNYKSEFNCAWDDSELRKKFHFRTRYPQTGAGGIAVTVSR